MSARSRFVVATLAVTALVFPLSATAAEPRVEVAHATPITSGDVVRPASGPTSFAVVLRPRDPAGLSAFLTSLTTPGSANYHRFLTPAQYGARFGASPAALAQLTSYFASYDVRATHVSTARLTVDFTGAPSAVAHALSTSIARVSGANVALRPVTLPASLAHLVAGVDGLSAVNGLRTHLSQAHAVSQPTTCAGAGSDTGNTANSLSGFPATQQAQIYGLSAQWAAGFNASGVSIGVYELGQYQKSDVATFATCYGLTPHITTVNVDNGPSTLTYSDEATMDIEEATALAPGASLVVYQGPNANSGPLDTYQQIADDDKVAVVTTSWGDCESDPSFNPQSEQPIFEQMAAEGMTVISAAGDNGSSDCVNVSSNPVGVDDPASQPLVTGVGGLTLSSLSPLTQSVWNSSGGAGGGGISTVWGRPSWQTGDGITSSATMRMVPDLSVMADPSTGFLQYYTGSGGTFCRYNCTGGWSAIGGTSIGAPLVAAMVATAIQSCGGGNFGPINASLYAMSATGFIDVTQGNNDTTGTGNYSATPGYDMASGLGSPSPTTFYKGLCPSAFSPTTSSFYVTGTPVAASSPATLTAQLLDPKGKAIAGAALLVTATSTSGQPLFNSDATSATSTTSASVTLTTDNTGLASATLSNDSPGTVSLSVNYLGQTIYSTTVTFAASAASAACLPAPPRVQATVVRGGAVLRVVPSTSPCAHQRYQWQGAGHGWTTFSGATSTRLSGLRSHVTYQVKVRSTTGQATSRAVTLRVRPL